MFRLAVSGAPSAVIESEQDKGQTDAGPRVANAELFFNANGQTGSIDCTATAYGVLASKAAIEVVANLGFASSLMKQLQFDACSALLELDAIQAHLCQDSACSPMA